MRKIILIEIFVILLILISLAQSITRLSIDKNKFDTKAEYFTEFNKNQNMYNIEKIEYQTTRCFGTCPQFNIVIYKSKKATLFAEAFNSKEKKGKEIKGKFYATINERDFNEIFNLLNDIDFPNLKDKYNNGQKDTQACFLMISYENSKFKRISDYGLSGTPELKKFYKLMFELRFNQDWKKE